MHYEEKVIEGVLCWRGTPGGEWTQFTLQEFTEELLRRRKSNKDNLAGWVAADAELRKIKLMADGP